MVLSITTLPILARLNGTHTFGMTGSGLVFTHSANSRTRASKDVKTQDNTQKSGYGVHGVESRRANCLSSTVVAMLFDCVVRSAHLLLATAAGGFAPLAFSETPLALSEGTATSLSSPLSEGLL